MTEYPYHCHRVFGNGRGVITLGETASDAIGRWFDLRMEDLEGGIVPRQRTDTYTPSAERHTKGTSCSVPKERLEGLISDD